MDSTHTLRGTLSGAGAMIGSGLSTEVVGSDGMGTLSLAGITESLVGVKR